MRLATAFVEVRPDTRNFKADLKASTESDARDVGKILGQALAGGAFLAGAKRATDAASQLEQAVGGTAAVFGEAADEVEDFAKGAAESAGLSERAARELTSTLGGLLKGFGFTADEAAGLSVQLSTLGADLAATFGGNPEEAVQALGAALRGETDPLERFGIALNQTLVNQKAVELGLAASTTAVDQHAKAQATLALITERSADAQGQFAREADTAAGQAAIAAAKTENSAADLGQNLLPVYTRIAETVGLVADAFGALPEPVQTALIVLTGVVALAGPVNTATKAVGALADIVRTKLASGMETAALQGLYLKDNIGRVAAGAGALGLALAGASILLQSYQKDKAEAARLEQAYTDILAEQTEGVGENTKAFAGSEILKGGLGEKLRDAGADVGVFTDAITTNTDRVADLDNNFNALYGAIGGIQQALDDAGLEGTAFADELIRVAEAGDLSTKQALELVNRLSDQAEGYKAGTREAANKAEADKAAGKESADAAPKIEASADALSLEEEAAKDAAAAIDAFREAVEKALAPLDFEAAIDRQAQAIDDLAQGIVDRSRAVEEARARLIALRDDPESTAAEQREAERELQEAVEATSLSLEGNTDAARRNREELRSLIDDSVAVIETARDQGQSLEDLQAIRAIEIDSLRRQLTEMGYTRAEVDRYIERIEAIPLTKTTVLDADTAKADIKLAALQARIDKLIQGGQQASIDVLQAESQLARRTGRQTLAAGGAVMDGDFEVHDGEVMRKRGSQVDVLAGSPSLLGGGAVINIYVSNPAPEPASTSLDKAARRITEEIGTR